MQFIFQLMSSIASINLLKLILMSDQTFIPNASEFRYAGEPFNSKLLIESSKCVTCSYPAYNAYMHSCGALRCGTCSSVHQCNQQQESDHWIAVNKLPSMMKDPIVQIKVRCAEEKCKFVGTREEYLQHQPNCAFKQVKCNCCSQMFTSKALALHAKSCVLKPCFYCGKSLSPFERKQHSQEMSRCNGMDEFFHRIQHPVIQNWINSLILKNEEKDQVPKINQKRKFDEDKRDLKEEIALTMSVRDLYKILRDHQIDFTKGANKAEMVALVAEAVKNKKIKLTPRYNDKVKPLKVKLMEWISYENLIKVLRDQDIEINSTTMTKSELVDLIIEEYEAANLNLDYLFPGYGEVYVINKIVDTREKDCQLEFLVDWKDGSERSWEYESSFLTLTLTNEYIRELQRDDSERIKKRKKNEEEKKITDTILVE